MNKSISFVDLIAIDASSKTPKYRQIISAIINAIENKVLKKGERLPSINELSEQFYLSRDTVEKAYRELKMQGVLLSSPGKGFYIDKIDVKVKHKILLLFNKLSRHKKVIYDNFINALGGQASVDFYIYNNDYKSFETLLINSLDKYSHYVIIPHFNLEHAAPQCLLNQIPNKKLILMDKHIEGINTEYSAVIQNYESDIFNVLVDAEKHIAHYNRVVLVFPNNSYHPKQICKGFLKAMGQLSKDKLIVKSLDEFNLAKGDVLVLVEEGDLIEAIKYVRRREWKIGKDVGLISYNETPIKEVLADGISVISTDFAAMGKKVAELIISNQKAIVENPFQLIKRTSF